MKNFLNKMFKDNVVFSLMLGLCSVLAVTKTFENGLLMGLSVFIVLVLSNLIIALIRKFIPENVKLPVYILIIGTFVTILELLLEKYIPNLYSAFSIYLSLIVVNCIVLGNALSIKKDEKILTTFTNSLGTGIGYVIAISLISFIREVLGTNTLTIMDNISSFTGYKLIFRSILPTNDIFPMIIFTQPAGAFITLALLMALFKKIGGIKHESN